MTEARFTLPKSRRARRRFARAPKYFLALSAVGVAGAMFLFAEFRDVRPEWDFAAELAIGENGEPRLNGPTLTGTASNGRPFTLRAEWAEPDAPNPERVILHEPRGEITLEDGQQARVRAKNGTYRPKIPGLLLTGDILLDTDSGYRFRTERAELDGRENRLRAPETVEGEGPEGVIRADSMLLTGREGQHIAIFEGKVRLRLAPAPIPRGGGVR